MSSKKSKPVTTHNDVSKSVQTQNLVSHSHPHLEKPSEIFPGLTLYQERVLVAFNAFTEQGEDPTAPARARAAVLDCIQSIIDESVTNRVPLSLTDADHVMTLRRMFNFFNDVDTPAT